MMQLFYSDASPFARKARIVVLEANLEDQVEEIAVQTSPLKSDPDLQKLNPLGKIPCLTLDDGTVVVDSRVICHYLDRAGHGVNLHPSGNMRHNSLMALCDGVLDAAVSMVYEKRVRPSEFQYEEWIEAQWVKVSEALKYIQGQYLDILQHFNMAAIGMVVALEYLDLRHDDRNWRALAPELASWHETVKDRPSFVTTRPK